MFSKYKQRITALIIAFLCLVSFCELSQAGVFGPSSKSECLTKYAARAQTKFATNTLSLACRDLFEDQNFKSYLNSEYDFRHIEFLVNPETGALEAYDTKTKKWDRSSKIARYSALLIASDQGILPDKKRKDLKSLKQEILEDAARYKEEKQEKAKCIIGLSELYNAKNDIAARIIIDNSKCH